jgi:PAS domain S-box-containing protein
MSTGRPGLNLNRLNTVSSRLWRIRDLHQGLQEMLVATTELLRADMGNVQLLDADRGVLVIVAQQGFGKEFLEFFREVSKEDESACGRALRSGERIIIEDVETDPAYATLRSIARASGYRAVQSTPLIGRNGAVLGVLSTHFRSPHRPSQQELQGADLYVRQAADFIERCKADEALHKSEATVRALLETAAQAIIAVDSAGRIEIVNATAEQMFGYTREEILGRPVEMLIPAQLRDLHQRHRADYFANPHARPMGIGLDLAGRRKDGSEFPIEVGLSYMETENGRVAVSFITDITERKLAEGRQRESEARFRHMADSAPVLIWMSGTDKLCTWFNKPWLDFVGRPMEKELGNGWTENVHPDDFDHCLRIYTESFDARQPFVMDYRLRRNDGEYRWLSDRGIPLSDRTGTFSGYVGSCVDITDRKLAEKELQSTATSLRESQESLQSLAGRLLTAQEEAAQSIARELHDVFGQKMALLSLKVSEIEALPPTQQKALQDKLRSCREQIGVLAQDLHDFSRQLHPSVLHELGLEVALRAECDGYAQRNGTTLVFSAENVPEFLREDISLCLYRVAQESLHNIWKHAQSNRVGVVLKASNQAIELVVEDFGKGFDLEATKGNGGLGLISMQERVRLVGGSLAITTKAGDGTRVQVRIPLRSE